MLKHENSGSPVCLTSQSLSPSKDGTKKSLTKETSSRMRPNVAALSVRSSLTCLETSSLCVISSPASKRAWNDNNHKGEQKQTCRASPSRLHTGPRGMMATPRCPLLHPLRYRMLLVSPDHHTDNHLSQLGNTPQQLGTIPENRAEKQKKRETAKQETNQERRCLWGAVRLRSIYLQNQRRTHPHVLTPVG